VVFGYDAHPSVTMVLPGSTLSSRNCCRLSAAGVLDDAQPSSAQNLRAGRVRSDHTVARDAASDGCFPLINNDRDLTDAQILAAYRYQRSSRTAGNYTLTTLSSRKSRVKVS
jgi:hypothetical protein